jgi:DSF synthase
MGAGFDQGVSPHEPFAELDVSIDEASRTYWCMMRSPQPTFRPALLRDFHQLRHTLRRHFIGAAPEDPPIRYLAFGSYTPGVFNLGGDLNLFGALIRRRDRERLSDYAHACVDVSDNNAASYGLPIITIAMVQGDALGGGFEAALSCNIIVAEKRAKFGLPEVLFNLFPGMGAYSFLSRRVGAAMAEKMIISGKIYDAAELHAMGIVDILVEDGEGPAAVRSYITRNTRRHNAEQAVYQVRRRVDAIPYEELSDITKIWVEAALRLTETDLRKMERIAMAQNRRWAKIHGAGWKAEARPA